MKIDKQSFDQYGLKLKSFLQLDSAAAEYFDLYLAEARFAIDVIQPDLANEEIGVTILEVGAGSLILSVYLAELGNKLVCIEPVQAAFSHFSLIQQGVMNYIQHNQLPLRLIDSKIEDLDVEFGGADYAFSINVFEHVTDVETAFVKIFACLRAGAIARIYCPNSFFPYEPHFNLLALPSKRLTEMIYPRKRIKCYEPVNDPIELWNSLNWVSYFDVAKICRRLPSCDYHFNREVTRRVFQRVKYDDSFNTRRSKWMLYIIRGLFALKLDRILSYIPHHLAPVIDVALLKKESS